MAQLLYADEFNSFNAAGWNSLRYYDAPGSIGSVREENGEQSIDINADGPAASLFPVTAANGVLNITASKVDAATADSLGGYNYISADIDTRGHFEHQYGYIEFRAKMPTGEGLHSSFFLLKPVGWPPEIDVTETRSAQPDMIVDTVHKGYMDPVDYAVHDYAYDSQWHIVGDTTTDFHTYAVDWKPGELDWYFDGQLLRTTTLPENFNTPMFIEMNLAVGDNWAGSVPADFVSSTLQVDYVRWYDSNPYVVASQEVPPDPAPLPDPDQRLYGTTKAETFVTGSGNDYVSANSGADSISTGAGNDTIYGGSGNDTINAGPGNDTICGQSGNDVFVFQPGFGNDLIYDFAEGRSGYDVLRFEGFGDMRPTLTADHGATIFTFASGDTLEISSAKPANFYSDDWVFV